MGQKTISDFWGKKPKQQVNQPSKPKDEEQKSSLSSQDSKKESSPSSTKKTVVTKNHEPIPNSLKKETPHKDNFEKNSSSSSPASKKTSSQSKGSFSIKRKLVVVSDSDDDGDYVLPTPNSGRAINTNSSIVNNKSKQSNMAIVDDDDDELSEEEYKPTKKQPQKVSKPSPQKPKTSTTSKDNDQIGTDSISNDSADVKGSAYQKFLAKKAKLAAGPKAPGSKEIPIGADNCLEGLTFVFTGELTSISREQAQDLAKRYGGRVTGAPSKKTSYLVVGEDPGESKLSKASSCDVKKIDEDGFFDLIRNLSPIAVPSSSNGAPNANTPLSSQNYSTYSVSSPPKSKAKPKTPKKLATFTPPSTTPLDKRSSGLWTDKYKPQTYADIIGNKSNIEKLALWLREWQTVGKATSSSGKSGYRVKDDILGKRAVLISGPPGIGKTTTAHLVCKLEGYEAIEFNASDTRSKKTIDAQVKDLTTSHTMAHYFGTKQQKSKRQVIIMDEVDGMSAGDRGGSGQLITLIKETKVPIICICNDRQSTKVRSLANYCYDMRFRRPTADQVEKRLQSIAAIEGIQLKPNAVQNLVESTQGDIRQILNLLSTYNLSKKVLSYDDSKRLRNEYLVSVYTTKNKIELFRSICKPRYHHLHSGKESEKNMTMGPWDIVRDLFSPQIFRHASLSDKMDYYFNDYQLVPLMVQENYIRMNPAIIRDMNLLGSALQLETLNCLSQAANAIADADMIEGVIRSTNNWTLLPAHAVSSTVRPAFFMHGVSNGQIAFPSWLGNFSKEGKYNRLLKELYIRMRLNISGDKQQVRQAYIPALAPFLTKPLLELGKDGVPLVIELMDDYYLTKEDWEVLLEMGLGHLNQANLISKIPTAVKSDLTRTYNKGTHPIPFMSSNEKVSKISAGGAVKPDFEDVVDEDVVEEEEEINEDDISVDKFIKAKKSGAASKSSTGTKSKGRGK